MALKQHGFFNFDELRKKEFEKKLIIITPNQGSKNRNNLKNDLGISKVVGFLEEVPRISGTANWKSYSELFGDAVGKIDAYSEDIAASYKTIRGELKAYQADLLKHPEIIAITKVEGLDQEIIDDLIKH